MGKSNSIIWTMLSDDDFSKLVESSKTYTGILGFFGLTNKGGNHKTLKRRIEKLEISTDHLGKCYDTIAKIARNKKIPLSNILVSKSKYGRKNLKERLLKEGLIKNECSICGLGPVWNDKKIIMVLDHINGDGEDHRIENLRMICPNCNSQTDTFAGKNHKVKSKSFVCSKCGLKINRYSKLCVKCSGENRRKYRDRPDKETLQKMISELSWLAIGRKYGVSDNAVRKWARGYGLISENRIRAGSGRKKKNSSP